MVRGSNPPDELICPNSSGPSAAIRLPRKRTPTVRGALNTPLTRLPFAKLGVATLSREGERGIRSDLRRL